MDADIVGDIDNAQAPRKVLADTVWIIEWTFDGEGMICTDAGWEKVDNHILNDGSVYWRIGPDYGGMGGIAGQAAILGYQDSVCCSHPNGYGSNWYQVIRLPYRGSATLAFDYLLDTDRGYDFIQIECDSACASFDRVDYQTAPRRQAASYRTRLYSDSGLVTNGRISAQPLVDFGAGTHCAYVSFLSDDQLSPCDRSLGTTLGAGCVVDNLLLTDADGTRNEGFDDGELSHGWAFLNARDMEPFGQWGRLYWHISDNEVCTEDWSCAWLWTDDTTPTIATDLSRAFGPGAYVVRNWLDNILISPWVSLAAVPNAFRTVLQFRNFPGNSFSSSLIVMNWALRGKTIVQGRECVSPWDHAYGWTSLSTFKWIKTRVEVTPYFDPQAEQVQVRFRVSDWQWIAGAVPSGPLFPGPGPYVDDVRIGRILIAGPVLSEGVDARWQAQDCFPTEIHPGVTPAGEHYRPTTDRFGTCAFSMGGDLGINRISPNRIQHPRGAWDASAVHERHVGAPAVLQSRHEPESGAPRPRPVHIRPRRWEHDGRFPGDLLYLAGGCPATAYDGIGTAGTAVATHAYAEPARGQLHDGAIAMNSSPAENWNTILQSHPWSDVFAPFTSQPPDAEDRLMRRILEAVLPPGCAAGDTTTEVPDPERIEVAPLRTALLPNVPNPFNPTTRIRFDLSHTGRVELRIHDVTGKRVRTLFRGWLEAKRHELIWNGMDDAGRFVPSGVYLLYLDATGVSVSRKIAVMR